MKEIISIVNQKGGSGKTTTTLALGMGLKKKGYRILFVDMDGQANLSDTMQTDKAKRSVLDLLTNQANIDEVIQKTPNGDILPGKEDLFQADVVMDQARKENLLKEVLGGLKEEYDYIIIDTQPALSILTINALVASSCVIIASQAEWYNASGVERICRVIESIHNHRNRSLNIKGILITKFKARTRLNKEFRSPMDEIAKKVGTKVFKTTIRDSIVISEAQIKCMSIFDYAPKSNVVKDYEMFVEEFLQ